MFLVSILLGPGMWLKENSPDVTNRTRYWRHLSQNCGNSETLSMPSSSFFHSRNSVIKSSSLRLKNKKTKKVRKPIKMIFLIVPSCKDYCPHWNFPPSYLSLDHKMFNTSHLIIQFVYILKCYYHCYLAHFQDIPWGTLAGQLSWLKRRPHTPRLQVWSQVRAHMKINPWMHK